MIWRTHLVTCWGLCKHLGLLPPSFILQKRQPRPRRWWCIPSGLSTFCPTSNSFYACLLCGHGYPHPQPQLIAQSLAGPMPSVCLLRRGARSPYLLASPLFQVGSMVTAPCPARLEPGASVAMPAASVPTRQPAAPKPEPVPVPLGGTGPTASSPAW